jgi:hypothetical protein
MMVWTARIWLNEGPCQIGCRWSNRLKGAPSSADDEFLCSEALALWAMIRKARALAGQT